MNFEKYPFIVVGCGFYGAVIAERIANDMNENVLLIDKKNHVGGNCYSENDSDTGIHYHLYGTHIFHTSNKIVWEYINRYTEFNSYYHQVLTVYKNKVYQMPINLETINSFFGTSLKPYEVDGFIEKEIGADNYPSPTNFEEKAISLVGRKLYKAFIQGYTKKQWQKDPVSLPASILTRLPFRKNYNESYYHSTWQGIPLDGYAAIFNRMLKNKKIDIQLKCDYFDIKNLINKNTFIIYTGPIDQYFDYKFGHLEYRSVRFEKEVLPYQDYQGTSVMNYAEEFIPYTRIHEPKHLHPEQEVFNCDRTMIIREYPEKVVSEPYYPINDEKNQRLFSRYQECSRNLREMFFGGRLGDYRYYDMHDTIASALKKYQEIKTQFKKEER